MTEPVEQTTAIEMTTGCRTAWLTARVAGAFSILFLVALGGNFIGTSIIGPNRENVLTQMKAEIGQGEATEAQLAEIRQLDLKIRRDRMWRLDFARKASYMLLASIAIFLVAGKLAAVLSKTPPKPQHAPDIGAEQIREGRRSRWAVITGLLILVAGGTALVMVGAPAMPVKAEEAGPSYATEEQKREQWHRFRGPGGAGVSVFTNIPTEWDGKAGKGILWKTPVPLIGHNSPIVWKDRVFLSGANEEKREVYCYDATSGKLLWTGDVPTVPAISEAELEIMEDTGYSACTMATDGKRVYAIFATADIAAFDFNGRRLWHRNLGVPDNAYGYASSLAPSLGCVMRRSLKAKGGRAGVPTTA